jgi:hypothetical protein
MPLQQPFRIACLDGRDDLKIIGVDDDRSGCQLLKVGDLRESERAQVSAGLPAGTVDDAIRQLKEPARPRCYRSARHALDHHHGHENHQRRATATRPADAWPDTDSPTASSTDSRRPRHPRR